MRSSIEPAVRLIDGWPAQHASVADVAMDGGEAGIVGARGDQDRRFPLASVTKLLSATATLVAVQEEAVDLDAPAGPDGSTLRHLLSHASGLGPDGGVLAPPGRRRIYSNAGFDLVGEMVSGAAGMPFVEYLRDGVLRPLGMRSTTLDGSPAHGATSTAGDLARLAMEVLSPGLLDAVLWQSASAVAIPGLDGVLPGYGQQSPNDWGLGFEIRGTKRPHWTGAANTPSTVGHFGRSGTFLWADRQRGAALVCLTDLDFGPWAVAAWPALADAVLAAVD